MLCGIADLVERRAAIENLPAHFPRADQYVGRPTAEDGTGCGNVYADVEFPAPLAVEAAAHHGQQPDFAGDEFPARQFAVSVRGRIQQPFEVGQESDGDDHDAAVGLCREDLPVFFHGIECLRRRCRKDA